MGIEQRRLNLRRELLDLEAHYDLLRAGAPARSGRDVATVRARIVAVSSELLALGRMAQGVTHGKR